nr:diacylglycerol kinase family protein [Lactiplantibacillus plantarum]
MIAEYYIIINELAGSGHGKVVWETVKPILEQRQIRFEYRISEYAGHTIRPQMSTLKPFNDDQT